jgi:aspartate carbamoyltransferase catalytic subunit
VINAGDGTNQHPSQTLLDLYTIRKLRGRIGGVRIALVGDLKYSRTVHSLFRALRLFPDVEFLLVSPPSLRMPEYLLQPEAGARVTESADLREAVAGCDVLYMTRIQKERFPDLLDYEKVKGSYRLDAAALQGAPAGLKVLHPLPRVGEIACDVDDTPHSGYFQQVANGLIMRQAILLKHLGEDGRAREAART